MRLFGLILYDTHIMLGNHGVIRGYDIGSGGAPSSHAQSIVSWRATRES